MREERAAATMVVVPSSFPATVVVVLSGRGLRGLVGFGHRRVENLRVRGGSA